MNALTQSFSAPPGRLVDDPRIRETYADNVVGAIFNQGNITVTLAATRADHAGDTNGSLRTVVDRVVIPVTVAAQLRDALDQVLNDLETRGFIKKAPPAIHALQ